MFKRINIIVWILLFFTFSWIKAQDNFKIFTPEYILSDINFEISIITSKKFPQADKLEVFFAPDISLNIINVKLFTHNQSLQIPFHSEFIEEYSDQFKKVSVDLTDSSEFSDGSFFQLVISLKSTQANPNNIKYFGKFLKGNELLDYLANTELENNSSSEHIYQSSFRYYQRYPIAGKALSLLDGSYLNVPLDYSFDKVLSTEFWMKLKNQVSTFLKIINWGTNRVEYSLSLNDNQMLVINSIINEPLSIRPYFISQNVWYHFNINFEKEKSELAFFCDDIELARYKVYSDVDFENLVLHFQNENQTSEIVIDQLRLIAFEENSYELNRNKNYLDYSDVQSKVILQINFDDAELNTLVESKAISCERIRLLKSDAPIFPRSPEINVKISETYYDIEWESASNDDAVEFVLERSVGNSDFIELNKVVAVKDENKKYSLLSEKVMQQEIVYFRIKQINRDGSIVYSEIAKVGQGIIEDVIVGQNYPNPFNPTTSIKFELLQDSDVEVKVYNLAGKEIALLHKGFLSKGDHQFTFDASEFPSGVYLYQIITSLSSQTRKMILAK